MSVVLVRQIQVPENSGTFFAPVFDRGGSLNGDRDKLVTEDVVQAMKSAGIKGVTFERLATAEEEMESKSVRQHGKEYKPPKDRFVTLR